jgi:hypothetical protein
MLSRARLLRRESKALEIPRLGRSAHINDEDFTVSQTQR